MTTEEAIRILNPETYQEAICEIEYCAGFSAQQAKVAVVMEACRIAVAALRARQSRTLDRSRWEGCKYCNDSSMGIWIGHHYQYCPYCGAPQNEKAWAELERRIGGIESQ